MKILASKNYDKLSYMVDSEEVLIDILEDECIITSDPEKSSRSRFVSLSRDLRSAASRNPSRWKYGVILDGSRLTEHYVIKPYSYAGTEYESGRNTLRVKSVTSYDTGEYFLTLVNHPTQQIPKQVFDEIVDLIESDAQGINTARKLIHKQGTRRFRGRLIVDQYTYNVPHGGLVLKEGVLSNSSSELLIHHTNLNETEERLYTNSDVVNISNCIVGVILPSGFTPSDYLEDIIKTNHYVIYRY